jgi:hypothetical protein
MLPPCVHEEAVLSAAYAFDHPTGYTSGLIRDVQALVALSTIFDTMEYTSSCVVGFVCLLSWCYYFSDNLSNVYVRSEGSRWNMSLSLSLSLRL